MYTKLIQKEVSHQSLFGIICTIYLESSTKAISTTWTSHWWTTSSPVKPSISVVTLLKNAL